MLYAALHPPLQGLGSFANLDTASIPEEDDGFRVVREWAQDVCSNLGYNALEPTYRFRQWFMVACTLAFDFDRENSLDFVPRTPKYKSTLWPSHLSRKGADFTVRDSVAFVTAEAYDLLTVGSSYLRYVQLDTQIHVHPF